MTAIAAGGFDSFALKTDGTVVAWGAAYDGTKLLPANVPPGLYGVTAIAANEVHTIAVVGTAVALQASPTDAGLVLSWPTNRAGFTLQSAPSLAAPVAWGDSAAAPAVVGARYAVTNKAADGARFFRLRK